MNKQTIITLLLALASFPLAAQEKADTVKNEKERKLTLYAKVADHLTHVGIDSLRATLLLAADSSFVDTVHIESYNEWNTDRKVTYVTADVGKPGNYLLQLEAKGYTTRWVPIDIPKLYKRELYRELKPIYLKALPKRKDDILRKVLLPSTFPVTMSEVNVSGVRIRSAELSRPRSDRSIWSSRMASCCCWVIAVNLL